MCQALSGATTCQALPRHRTAPTALRFPASSRARSAGMRNHLTTSASLDKAASALIHEQVHS